MALLGNTNGMEVKNSETIKNLFVTITSRARSVFFYSSGDFILDPHVPPPASSQRDLGTVFVRADTTGNTFVGFLLEIKVPIAPRFFK